MSSWPTFSSSDQPASGSAAGGVAAGALDGVGEGDGAERVGEGEGATGDDGVEVPEGVGVADAADGDAELGSATGDGDGRPPPEQPVSSARARSIAAAVALVSYAGVRDISGAISGLGAVRLAPAGAAYR